MKTNETTQAMKAELLTAEKAALAKFHLAHEARYGYVPAEAKWYSGILRRMK